MKTFKSETHRATVDKTGILNVYNLKEPALYVKTIKFDSDEVTEEEIALENAEEWEKRPFLRAAYAGDDMWHVDLLPFEFQPWKGYKTDEEVAIALQTYQFSVEDKGEIIRLCGVRAHERMKNVNLEK